MYREINVPPCGASGIDRAKSSIFKAGAFGPQQQRWPMRLFNVLVRPTDDERFLISFPDLPLRAMMVDTWEQVASVASDALGDWFADHPVTEPATLDELLQREEI